ncbi:MAG: hypothetical protein HXY20_02365 [Acidobacteria bacterium]|nr:hypothetical protein [Acidobacteriota bacterium]
MLPGQSGGQPPASVPAEQAVVAERWKEVDRMVSEQKFEAALKEVEKIRQNAQKRGDQNEWTRALIKEVQLRIGLHGYETAVRFLKDQAWPAGRLNRAVLNLFYARSLVTYYHAYSWEINRRERLESRAAVDLRAWTRDQIYLEAQKAYAEVWAQRAGLGREPVARLAEYLDANDYPKNIRGTLRDAVSYLFVDLLADTSLWKPEEVNELYRLGLESLVAGAQPSAADASLTDAAVHPLTKIGRILDDLESWHTRAGRAEAALEARLERLRRLHASFTGPEDRKKIAADLEKRLPAFRKFAWWAVGMATQAEFARESDEPGRLMRARAIAEEGWKAYPRTTGGQRCLHIMRSIEAPDYSVASMITDGVQRRSIEVTHKNLTTLYLRAYAFDLERRVEAARDYSLLPNHDDQRDMLKREKPAAEWRVNLPATPDYEPHRTFVTAPLESPGCFLIMVSAKPDFSDSKGNRVLTTHLVVSDIVIVHERRDPESVEVRILAGESGKPVEAARVSLYRYDWQIRHARADERVTDADGQARFAAPRDRERYAYFLLARKGPSVAFDSDAIRFYEFREPAEVQASLIYTDRSVYRPLQKVQWKLLLYRGSRREGRFRIQPSQAVTVSLLDPNGQVVESRTATTNAFGTASGEFNIPGGRVLGSWRIRSSQSGETGIRVEEYKRPTFEVTLKDSEAPLRLNRPATFTGEARYYFGLPVTNGNVKWRATMEPEYPWWWDWHGWVGPQRTSGRIAASGLSSLASDGTFKITFTPEADERLSAASREITYRFRVTADLTDEGGETRSVSRSFRLGFVSVEARIDMGAGFLMEEEAGTVAISRTDLNGQPRQGKGSWRLTALSQPEKTLLPADQPIADHPREGSEDRFRTPGDRMRPRWNPQYSFQSVLRRWPDGLEIARGPAAHDDQGRASVNLPKLPSGAYRFHYETTDDFGVLCRSQKEIIVGGNKTTLALPAVLVARNTFVKTGESARFLVHSGLPGQALFLERWRDGRLSDRRQLMAGTDPAIVEIPMAEGDRGGIGVRLVVLADYQLMRFDVPIHVPWDNKELEVAFSTFRDKLKPGARETWRVHVKGREGSGVEAGAAELLAYMYDRSLDIFAPHTPPNPLSLYPIRSSAGYLNTNLGQSPTLHLYDSLVSLPAYPALSGDRLKFYDNYGIGGPGMRQMRFKGGVVGGVVAESRMVLADRAAPVAAAPAREGTEPAKSEEKDEKGELSRASRLEESGGAQEQPDLRSDFAETAFWEPHLLTGGDGSATIEFTVPDSVTAWNVWVHAVTRDLEGGRLHREARSIKDLMVRPYLPRFLREGDQAVIKVVVNNASGRQMSGKVTLDILDPLTEEGITRKFELTANVQPFTVTASGGANVAFAITAPVKVGMTAFKVVAAAEDMSDGELRPVPLLPGRVHLAQSRFVALNNRDRRVMTFEDLKKQDDPTLVNQQLVVTLDAQLFYSVLSALPYLVNYPYECTEQTLNRFVSTGILTGLYQNYPAVARMAQEFARRDTRLETRDAADPNRRMVLEETPWLVQAKGGREQDEDLINALDPRIARANRDAALDKLRKAQTSIGGFPWWPGGPPSPYMTLYIMYGLAKAAEFGVEIPRDMVERGWGYLSRHFREEYARRMIQDDCCWEFLTFLNYTASCYPDPSWMGDALTQEERKAILDHCFKHWKQHSPYLKGMLALTLQRMGRPKDARLVFDSVMDSARTTQDEGTFWAPEERAWLWYNDTIETHAFALRTLMELYPQDARKDGLVQWLFLNKKLNHWKSTRATAEVIYSIVHYLKREGALGTREDATVLLAGQSVRYVFEPDKYTGKKNQIVVPGDRVGPGHASITVEKESKGFVFASATWHFSTERMPEEERGDFFSVSRKYFKRESAGREFVIRPLAEGEMLKPGDEVEIHLSIRSKHAAEYVHLRDPRAAGVEPENAISRYKWDLGIAWYEETRDSGTSFFFESLPAGEYTFRYRLRANMAGVFKVGPATIQSMYAPEFNAYSAGNIVTVK